MSLEFSKPFQPSIGAGEGNRTLVCSLGSCRSTIELRPRTGTTYSESYAPHKVGRDGLSEARSTAVLPLIARSAVEPGR
jgi:hypothetical protein